MTIDLDEARVERNEIGLWLGWTLATAGGMLLDFLPTVLLVNVLTLALAQIIVPVLTGAIIGFSQLFAAFIGYFLFGTTVIAVTSGLVAGAITGIALIWIVRRPEVA